MEFVLPSSSSSSSSGSGFNGMVDLTGFASNSSSSLLSESDGRFRVWFFTP